MIINASVNSKGFSKEGRKMAKKYDLRDCVGHLALDATNVADQKLLTAMYANCFGYLDKNSAGSIKVFDKDGKEVMHYFYEPVAEPATTAKAHKGE